MAGIETAVEAARRYIIKRPRLTRLLDNANARALMLVAPAGFGKTTLAREWVAERRHVWYRGTTATADVAALIAGLSTSISEVIPDAGARAVARMRATGTPEQDVDILADLFAEDLAGWPDDLWLVFDDYQFAMEARAPERFVDVLLRRSPMRLLLTSRKRPTWASAVDFCTARSTSSAGTSWRWITTKPRQFSRIARTPQRQDSSHWRKAGPQSSASRH